jgi:predicted transposase/invertase (TIGR01784 family)
VNGATINIFYEGGHLPMTNSISNNSDWHSLTGPLPFQMTNDFLFKFLLQTDNEVLKAIVCAFLDLNFDDIQHIEVTNCLNLGDDTSSKDMYLDIKAQMNNNTIINLEMQVENNRDWPERSISYLCRCFDNLNAGQHYLDVKSAIHIGFLNYTLFPDEPEFYASYHIRNDRTGYLYTGKFRISVVNLTQIDLATEDDKQHHRDLWAAFFKAKRWEDLIMLAQQDEHIEQAINTVHQLSEDERIREICWAREDYLRQQRDHDYWYEQKFKEQEAVMAEQEALIQQLQEEIQRLKQTKEV